MSIACAHPFQLSPSRKIHVIVCRSGHDTPTGQPKNSHLDFFTLATNESRAEAIAAGYTKVQSSSSTLSALSKTTSRHCVTVVQVMDIARVAVVGSTYYYPSLVVCLYVSFPCMITNPFVHPGDYASIAAAAAAADVAIICVSTPSSEGMSL